MRATCYFVGAIGGDVSFVSVAVIRLPVSLVSSPNGPCLFFSGVVSFERPRAHERMCVQIVGDGYALRILFFPEYDQGWDSENISREGEGGDRADKYKLGEVTMCAPSEPWFLVSFLLSSVFPPSSFPPALWMVWHI